MFIIVLTSAHHLSLSRANSIQSPQPPPTSWRSVFILFSHLPLGLPTGLFPSGFPTRTLCTPLPSPYAPHAPKLLQLRLQINVTEAQLTGVQVTSVHFSTVYLAFVIKVMIYLLYKTWAIPFSMMVAAVQPPKMLCAVASLHDLTSQTTVISAMTALITWHPKAIYLINRGTNDFGIRITIRHSNILITSSINAMCCSPCVLNHVF